MVVGSYLLMWGVKEEESILIPRSVNNCIPQTDASNTQLYLIVNRLIDSHE